MGIGYLTIHCRTGEDSLPVAGAHVIISEPIGGVLFDAYTDADGDTGTFQLTAPDKIYTLMPDYTLPAYSTCDVEVYAKGFVTEHIQGVQILDTQTSILPVEMIPLSDEAEHVTDNFIVIPPVGLLIQSKYRKIDPPADPRQVIIPDYITVHLGAPTNTSARNVRVKFADYVKNVASSEIYSTWPYNSLVANIHAIVTFALNRVYTEWYRGRGFYFDITNSTSYDQYFREGAQIFENISRIVDGIFNVYAHRYAFQNPFFTQFCNGTTVTCPGLSQWGTVALANQGMTPMQILHYYYPNDLVLATSNNITGITESYPGYALSFGSQGQPVRRMQNYLNRIRVNFPLIPLISNPNGIYGSDTQDAVRTFQRSFDLTPDGVIGRATWNKICFVFVGVARLAELDSEGVRISIGRNPPNVVLSQGATGENVLELQFIIDAIAPYHASIPIVIKDGVFGPNLKNAVIEFQKTFGLTQDGVVGPGTWNKLYSVYRGIQNNSPVPPAVVSPPANAPQFPGTPLTVGSTGPNVRLMQTYLNTIGFVYSSIPPVTVDSVFGEETRKAVIAFQQEFVLTPDGVIGPATWDYIVRQFMLLTGNSTVSG